MKSFALVIAFLSMVLASCSSKDKNKDQPQPQQSAGIQQQKVEQGRLDSILSAWPQENKQTVQSLISKYGQPDEATQTMVIWNNNGDWEKTIVRGDRQQGYLEQSANLKVGPERMAELSTFNKSLAINQSRNEVTAFSNMEQLNYLSLNLAQEIVSGDIGAMEARRQYDLALQTLTKSDRLKGLNFQDKRQSEEAMQPQQEPQSQL